jgi:hypothetical protein
MRDYLRATDLAHLPDEVITLYDDDTARGDTALYFANKLTSEASRRGQ